jgi:hypothetical protein
MVVRTGSASRRILLLAAGLLLFPVAALARIDLSPLASTLTLNWTGGDIVQAVDYCVLSILENQPTGTTRIDYDVTVSIGGTGAPYTLASGANTVPLTFVWRDLVAGVDYPLAPNTTTPEVLEGATNGCPTGNNGRLTLTIAAADLAAVVPGTYARTFDVVVTHSNKGRKTRAGTLTVNVTIPSVLQLSGLQDIALGMWDGLNDMAGADSMCIYINSAGLYSVTATGSGPGGAFAVSNAGQNLAMTVTWNDGTGAVALAPGVTLANRANSNSASPSCSSHAADNGTLGVLVTAATLNASPITGNFAGTITLTVIAH